MPIWWCLESGDIWQLLAPSMEETARLTNVIFNGLKTPFNEFILTISHFDCSKEILIRGIKGLN